METREAYKQKYEAQLKGWEAKVVEIKAHAQKVTAQAKIDFASHMNSVHEKYEVAKSKVEHIGHATDDKWHEVKTEADKAWHEMEHAIQGAFAAIKSHTKTPDAKK